MAEVDTIEVVPSWARGPSALLRELGYRNVHVKVGDGYEGWPDRAPFDAIMLTAAPPRRIPQPLLDQLKVGGRLVAPVGGEEQDLVRITQDRDGVRSRGDRAGTVRAHDRQGPARAVKRRAPIADLAGWPNLEASPATRYKGEAVRETRAT